LHGAESEIALHSQSNQSLIEFRKDRREAVFLIQDLRANDALEGSALPPELREAKRGART
jgi:hypothetical protein